VIALGAITTIGVAWACAWVSELRPVHGVVGAVDRTAWRGELWWVSIYRAHAGSRIVRRIVHKESEPAARQAHFERAKSASPGLFDRITISEVAQNDLGLYIEEQWGWPLPAMRSECAGHFSSVGPMARRVAWGVTWAGRFARPTPFARSVPESRSLALPLLPVVWGFAANTLFYAVALWGLFSGSSEARRRWRVAHGRCPNCAYDRRDGTGVCPECGAP